MVKEDKTIEEVIKNDLCHGCGICVSLCPRHALALFKSENKGIYLPKLEHEQCNKCGICYRVCPGNDVPFNKLNLEIFGKEPENVLLGNHRDCYTGFSIDYQIRFKSSSGGIVTSLLIYALEHGMINGALVTRMKQNRPLEPEPFIARTRKEIIEAATSKYCPVPANLALNHIMENDGKYAIVGLPCHIHGIRKYEQINRILKERLVFHMGLFCASSINFIGTELLIKKLGLSKTDILRLDYRSNGWPGNILIELKGETTQRIVPYKKYADSAFQAFAPWRCKLCIDHAAELADISFGDAWLPELISKDKIGSSIVVVRSQKGEEILRNAVNDKIIHIDHIDISCIMKSQDQFAKKKVFVIGRLKLAKTLKKKIPNYGMTLKSCSYVNYLVAVLDYLKTILAAHKSSWWLLRIYCNLLSFIRNLR